MSNPSTKSLITSMSLSKVTFSEDRFCKDYDSFYAKWNLNLIFEFEFDFEFKVEFEFESQFQMQTHSFSSRA